MTRKNPAWMADLGKLQAVAKENSFKPHKGFFSHTLSERASGGKYHAIVNASIGRAEKHDAKTRLVRVPPAIEARIAKEVSGPVSVALVALAEWALDQLDDSRRVLTVENKE